jgi:hypothetical protein
LNSNRKFIDVTEPKKKKKPETDFIYTIVRLAYDATLERAVNWPRATPPK